MAATSIFKSMPRLITACFKNSLFTVPDPQNIGIYISFVPRYRRKMFFQ